MLLCVCGVELSVLVSVCVSVVCVRACVRVVCVCVCVVCVCVYYVGPVTCMSIICCHVFASRMTIFDSVPIQILRNTHSLATNRTSYLLSRSIRLAMVAPSRNSSITLSFLWCQTCEDVKKRKHRTKGTNTKHIHTTNRNSDTYDTPLAYTHRQRQEKAQTRETTGHRDSNIESRH